MADKLQRPLVIGGITLGMVIWLLELLHQSVGEWGLYTVLALAISTGVWWVQRQSEKKSVEPTLPRYVDSATVKRTLAEAEQVLIRLTVEVEDPTPALAGVKPQISLLQSQMQQIATDIDRESLRVMVMGGKGSGKTTLIQRLQGAWTPPKALTFYEAPSFSAGTDAGLTAEAVALKQVMAADLVLLLVTGDLTDSELQLLKLLSVRKRTVLVFNKQDLYLPEERQTILNRMQEWGRQVMPVADVVAIATLPKPLKVRQHQEDGSIREWLEDQSPDVLALTQRLDKIIHEESRHLVLASSLGNAMALKAQAASTLNDVRRSRALPLVEQFQWLSAATAFASPVPSLDVVATAALNVQMILDLGAIYQHKFSLDQAQKVVTTLGSLILKLGLVELSTRTLSSLLKTNLITYVAGGSIQAVSAAYLTRVAGLALIEYFHSQEPNLTLTEAKPLAIERFSQILQQVFQQNQQVSFLQTLSSQVIDRLVPKVAPSTPQLSASTTSPIALSQSEIQILDHNGTGVCVTLPDLESTTIPSS